MEGLTFKPDPARPILQSDISAACVALEDQLTDTVALLCVGGRLHDPRDGRVDQTEYRLRLVQRSGYFLPGDVGAVRDLVRAAAGADGTLLTGQQAEDLLDRAERVSLKLASLVGSDGN